MPIIYAAKFFFWSGTMKNSNTVKIILAALLALAVLVPCVWAKKQKQDPNSVGMANPFKSCKSLKEAEKVAGFDFYLLDVFEDCAIQVYRAIPKQMLEAIYDSESGDEIRIRKVLPDGQ